MAVLKLKKSLSCFQFCILILCCLSITTINLTAQSFHLGDKLMSRGISDTSFLISKNMKETDLHYLNVQGKPMAVYILEVKLKRNQLEMEAATPFNKDTFCRQTVSEQMKWENSDHHQVLAGINADFFNMSNGTPMELEYKEGVPLKDAMLPGRGFVGVLKNGKVIIGDSLLYVKKKKQLKEALGGSALLIKDGHVIPQGKSKFSLTRHPRTALGIVNKRKVIFVVVDGRQPEYANGIPLDELALLMQTLGARTAINLDGGGSSTLVSKDKIKGRWIVRNHPSGRQERTVANAWIIVEKQ